MKEVDHDLVITVQLNRSYTLLITAKPFIDEIKERNIYQKPETEIMLNIMAENVNKEFGKAYWNEHLQRNFIISLIQCLRFLFK
jgi:hypothetical protein